MHQPALPFPDAPTKRCVDCQELKPLSEFHKHRGRRDGLQRRCKDCNIAINRRWYQDNLAEARERMYPYARRRRMENHQRVLDYLRSHACVDCGESDPVVLDFDHLRDKIRNVSALLTSPWAAIAAEIEKCEVVCANCHRRRTAARQRSFRHTATRSRPE